MILKFDEPMEISKARELYNDNVTFITSTKAYPKVEAIEFNDISNIEKRKIIAPKIHQKREKIVVKLRKSLDAIWNDVFNKIKSDLRSTTEKQVTISERRRLIALGRFSELRRRVTEESKKRFDEAFRLGKLRGQILTNQELDDDLTQKDEREIEQRIDEHVEYLAAFSKDLEKDVNTVLLEPFETYDELEEAITEKVQEAKRSRMNMYALAALGLTAVGMGLAIKEADPQFDISGGYWTVHPDEGKGGEICIGCSSNSGQWMTVEKFVQEYQNQNCLTNCRCDLDTRSR